MSNAPDRYDKFVTPSHLKKIAFKKDTKVEHAGSFVVQREDHTVGNLMRMQLHRDRHVVFSGYQIPHPLEHQMVVRVATDGEKRPTEAVRDALADLRGEAQDLAEQLVAQLERFPAAPR